MSANAKTMTVTLDIISKIDDVLNNTKKIQSALNQLKLPDNLNSRFANVFVDIEKNVKKAGDAINSNFKTKGDVTKFENSMTQINNLFLQLTQNMKKIDSNILKDSLQIDTGKLDLLIKKVEETKEKIRELNGEEALNNIQNQLEQLSKVSKVKAIDELKQALNAGDLEAAAQAMEKLKEHSDRLIKDGTKNATAFKEGFDQISASMATLQNNPVLKQLISNLAQSKKDVQEFSDQELARLISQFNVLQGQVDQTSTNIKNFGNSMGDTARQAQQLGSELDQFKNRIAYFFGLNNAVRLLQRAFRSAFSTIKELDEALTETAVVTNYTVRDMWAKIPEYTERANKLGVTIQDVAKASTLYYQQGLKSNEVTAVTTATLKMARIAGLDAADATDRMTNALRGFNMEISETNAERIADVYSKLAAMSASNVDEISTAMTKVASLAHNANMDFETTSAFLAQIIETTRESAETAGTALKTVVARFSEVKQLFNEGELLGTDEEGEAIDVNKVSKALRTAGINLNEYLTGVKGLDDIFMELASKWDSLDQVQQRYIATMAAGSRQQSRFIAMMQDYKRTQELVAAAQNAAGASQEQYQKTLDSLQSKLNKLKNSWNEFVTAIANQTIFKTIADSLRIILDLTNKLTGNSGLAKLLVGSGIFKIGRNIVKETFKGTEIARLFTKEGQKSGEGFVSGLFKSIKSQGAKQTFIDFKQKGGLLEEAKALEMLNKAKEKAIAENSALSASDAQAAAIREILIQSIYTNIIANEDLISSENFLNTIKSWGLSEEQAAIMISDESIRQKIREAVINKTLANDETRLNILESINNKIRTQGIKTRLKENALRIASIFGLYNEKAAMEAASGSAEKLNAIQKKSLITLGAWAAALIAVIAIYKLIQNNSPEKKLEKLNEKLEEQKNIASDASSAIQDLSDNFKSLEENEATLNNLTEGTDEWYTALVKVNSQIMDLIEKYPDLAQYIEVNKSGQMTFKEGSQDDILKTYRENLAEAQFQIAKTQIETKKTNSQINRGDLKNILLSYQNASDEDKAWGAGISWDDSQGNLMAALMSTGKSALSDDDVKEILQSQGKNSNISNIVIRDIRNEVNKAIKNEQSNETDAAIKTTIASVLSSQDYGKNSNLVKSLVNAETIEKFGNAKDLQKGINNFLSKKFDKDLVNRLLTGEIKAGDAKLYSENKELQEALKELGINIENFSNRIQSYEESRKEQINNLKELGFNTDKEGSLQGWVSNIGAETLTQIINKLSDLNFGDREGVKTFIDTITKNMNPEDIQNFVSTLFNADWEDIDSLNILKTKLEGLGIVLTPEQSKNLDELTNSIINFSKAVSKQATAINLQKQIIEQNEIVSKVDNNEALDNTQKGNLTKIGIPEDEFVMTAAGWIYTGDPDELLNKVKSKNQTDFDKAIQNWNTTGNNSDLEELQKQAQIMGANGQISDASQIQQKLSDLYDWEEIEYKSTQDEAVRNQIIQNNIKGLYAYADAYTETYEAVVEYDKAVQSGNQKEIKQAQLILETVIAAQRDKKQFENLTSVINDYNEVLQEGNLNNNEYAVALSKIAQASKSVFKDMNITAEFVDEHREDFIKMAEGDIEGLYNIRKALFVYLVGGMEDANEASKQELLDLLFTLNNLPVELNGTADATKLWEAIKIACENIGADATKILTSFGWTLQLDDDGNVRFIDKSWDVINTLGRSGRKSSGGSKEKPKYWDNPYDELYNLLEKQNEALRTREKLEREYDRILKDRSRSAKELLQNSLDEITNLRKELGIQEQIQAGRVRMINELGSKGHRDSEGNLRSFDEWGASNYAHYDFERNVVVIDWAAIDRINDPDKGGAIEAYISKLEELSSSFEETQDKIEEMKDLIQEIRERGMKEYIDYEKRALDAIIAREQKVIDEYSALSDTINESNSNILSSLRESIDLERQIRDNTKTEQDIADKEARLAYLQRDTSGANQQEILKLQKELDQARESYGDTLVDQSIENLETENEKAQEQRQQQIDIMQAQLNWMEETGGFWEEVYSLFEGSFDENGKVIEDSKLMNLIRQAEDYRGMSKFGKQNFDNDLIQETKQAYEGYTNWTGQGQGDDNAIIEETPVSENPYPSASGNLRGLNRYINFGDRSDAVRQLQAGLNDLVRDQMLGGETIDEDGSYGPATEQKVALLQSTLNECFGSGLRVDGYWGPRTYEALMNTHLNRYKTGGLVTSTGPAWLDGTKSSPEMVLSARDTENFIALRNALTQMVAQGGGKSGDNYFDIQINVDELGSDYDVDQLADKVKRQIVQDSMYRNVNAINYLR